MHQVADSMTIVDVDSLPSPRADSAAADEAAGEALNALLTRRSISAKRLLAPGPDAAAIQAMLKAALRAPDHGALHPWRVIEFPDSQRGALADIFEDEKRRRDPHASQDDLSRAREHATRSPVLLAFVVTVRASRKVPEAEQWLTAGAALGNLLNAAHMLGFGAIMLSGERCADPTLMARLGVSPDEVLAGFISVGSIAKAPRDNDHRATGEVWSAWAPNA